jgi:predicted transcriptional regulator
VRDQEDLAGIEIQGHVVVERRRNQGHVQMRDVNVQGKTKIKHCYKMKRRDFEEILFQVLCKSNQEKINSKLFSLENERV